MCKQGTAKEISAYLLCHVTQGFKIIYIYIYKKKTNLLHKEKTFQPQQRRVKSFEEILMVALEIITFTLEVFRYRFESSILSK